MEECDFRFSQEGKDKITEILLQDKRLPEFPYEIEKVSYMDGCKVYFKNKGWIIARFSGTEPLLRIFCEMPTLEAARETSDVLKQFLSLS